MAKIPVNIKLEEPMHAALEAARGDVGRTRFIERILEGDTRARMLLDSQLVRLGLKVVPEGERLLRAVPTPEPIEEELDPDEEPEAEELPAERVTKRPKRVTKTAAPATARPKEDPPSDPEPSPSRRKPEPPSRERPPRAKPVLTGRLRT